MKNRNIYIVAGTFYKELSSNLIQGAQGILDSVLDDNNLTIIKVPGAFEIPGMVKQIIDIHNPDLIITLGVLIKGETAHFEYISESVVHSIANLSISSNIPIVFGVLTTYDYEQAFKRADVNQLNNGGEVMSTLLDMLEIYSQIKNK